MPTGTPSPLFDETRRRVMEAVRRVGGTAGHAVSAIREAVSAAMQDPRAARTQLRERITDCVSAAAAAARTAGCRARDTVHGAMLGAMHGAKLEHAWATDTVESVSASLVRCAVVDRRDVEIVVHEAIESAIEAAHELSFCAEEAAAAAARGAVRAASELGPEMQKAVWSALPQHVKGVHVVRPEPCNLAAVGGDNGGTQ
ncbi:MAG: hypothetical protein HRF50_00500 [Phycisphaerae bacterium]